MTTATATVCHRFPAGFAARLRTDLLSTADELLVGGSPLRALRLSSAARSYLRGGRVVVGDARSAEIAARLLDGNLAEPDFEDLPGGGRVDPEDVTVVVPVRDRAEQLDRCLSALRPLVCLVVDDASLDRVPVATVVARHGAALTSLDRNLGPAAARNAGLAQVRTPYVAFVDSDVEVAASELLALARHFGDERVALVGPLVKGTCRSSRPRWFERYDAAASSLDLGPNGARVQPGATVAWLPSACLIGRAEVVRAAGGFDERMRVGEDVDLVWRLVGAGHVVRYDPSRIALHDTRGTLRAWLARKFVYGSGGAALAMRHGSWTAPALLSPTTALGAAAILARRRWSVPVALGSVALSARKVQRALPPEGGAGALPLAALVAVHGLGWAIRQESALLLRHWWPATVVGVLGGRPARRAVASALVVDVLVAARERPLVTPVTAVVGRRLDDLAYGAGLWWGALRARSLRCLTPARRAAQ